MSDVDPEQKHEASDVDPERDNPIGGASDRKDGERKADQPEQPKKPDGKRSVPRREIQRAAAMNDDSHFVNPGLAWEDPDTLHQIQSSSRFNADGKELEYKGDGSNPWPQGTGPWAPTRGGDDDDDSPPGSRPPSPMNGDNDPAGGPPPGGAPPGGAPGGAPPGGGGGGPPGGGGGPAAVNPAAHASFQIRTKLGENYLLFFRCLAGKLDQSNTSEIFTRGNMLDVIDIKQVAGFELTWHKPLSTKAEAWIRDSLDYLLLKFKRPKLGLFSEHLLKHCNIFLNLVILLRFKGRNRMKQQTWAKDATINEHNNDLCNILKYYATVK